MPISRDMPIFVVTTTTTTTQPITLPLAHARGVMKYKTYVIIMKVHTPGLLILKIGSSLGMRL